MDRTGHALLHLLPCECVLIQSRKVSALSYLCEYNSHYNAGKRKMANVVPAKFTQERLLGFYMPIPSFAFVLKKLISKP